MRRAERPTWRGCGARASAARRCSSSARHAHAQRGGLVVDRQRRLGRQARHRRQQAQHGPGSGDQERLPRLPHAHRARSPATEHFPRERLGQPRPAPNGGPIFGTAMDANFAARVPAETLEHWNQGDIAVTDAAARYLRRGNPTPASSTSASWTRRRTWSGRRRRPTDRDQHDDARIGRILRAIRSRPSYPFESWTMLVTTDHGERPLTEPSMIAHFGKTKLELTVVRARGGPGAGRERPRGTDRGHPPDGPAPAGAASPARWKIDGRSLSKARTPSSSASGRLRGGRLAARLQLGAAPRGVRTATFRLPAGARARTAAARVNGAPAAVSVAGRDLVARARAEAAERSRSRRTRAAGAAPDDRHAARRRQGRTLGVSL